MYSEIFEEIGLTKNESKIYEALLSTGESSISTIALKAGIHRRNIYDAINRLIKRGLVFTIFQKGENKYRAVRPDKLMEILKQKEQKLSVMMPELRKQYTQESLQEAAYMYKGKEGFKNYVRELMDIKEDGYFLGAKGLLYCVDKHLSDELWNITKQKKLDFYTLYDPAVKKYLPELLTYEGGKKKILPEAYATSGVLDIFGDHVVTFANAQVGRVTEDTTIFVMINRELAEAYKQWFRFIWEHSLEI